MRHARLLRLIVACVLVSFSLLILVRPSVELIQSKRMIKEEGGAYLLVGLDDNQLGWAQLTLVIVLLVIVWIPFRRGQIWAWLTLWLFLLLYAIPGLIYPARFDVTHALMWGAALPFVPMVVGLLLLLPDFFQKKGQRIVPGQAGGESRQ